MKKAKKIAALLVAFAALITGCSESYTPAGSVETPATVDVSEVERTTQEEELSQVEETLQEPEIKIEINTELLSEFGMTFAELEEKYGKAVSAEVTKGEDYIDVLYFFESSSGGYGFVADETDISEIILPDGSPQIKGDVEFKYFNGKAEDLFLGLETEVSIEELEKIYDVVMRPYMQADGSTFGAFAEYEYDGKHYNIHVLLKKDGIIDIDSFLGVSDNPQGM